jgi:hypothetical protein
LGLTNAWKSKETKEEESKINQWICDYHNLDLSSHNEKSEFAETSPSSGNAKKRKAEDELTPENTSTNRSPVEQGNKKRKIISPVANTPTLDRFFASSKKTTPTQPSKSKYVVSYRAPSRTDALVGDRSSRIPPLYERQRLRRGHGHQLFHRPL